MIKIFLKYLPVVAALCLATSCSKDDDNTVPTSEEGTQDITSNGIPFTLNAVATYSNSLSKIAYSDDIETQTVTMKFTSNDEGKIIMYVSDARIASHGSSESCSCIWLAIFVPITIKNTVAFVVDFCKKQFCCM